MQSSNIVAAQATPRKYTN